MLLETSSKDFRRMEVQLATGRYLSRAGASESVRINMDYEKNDVHMVHFSGKLKPSSHWMFDTASPRPTYKEFVNTTMKTARSYRFALPGTIKVISFLVLTI